MAIIDTLIGNGYTKLLGVGIVVNALEIIYFLEKIKEKIKVVKQKSIEDINKKYKNSIIKSKDVIHINQQLNKDENNSSNAEITIPFMYWSGILFIGICVLGIFTSFIKVIDEKLILFLLFISGAIFLISFFILMYWFVKN